jgi:hypothetical protein
MRLRFFIREMGIMKTQKLKKIKTQNLSITLLLKKFTDSLRATGVHEGV